MINSLKIKGLFGYKDVDIDFDENITLLIGRNGSGKTTILNILNSIISGDFDFLIHYKFDFFKLEYIKKGKEKFIEIDFVDFERIQINWSGKVLEYDLEDVRLYATHNQRNYLSSISRINEYVEERSPIQELFTMISKDFNKVYLPLSRNIGGKESKKKSIFDSVTLNENNITNLDESLGMVDDIVKQKQLDIMLQFNQMNKQMQKEMFQASFTFDNSPNIFFSDLEDLSSTLKSKNELIEAFKEMEMLNLEFEEQIDNFYEKLSSVYHQYKDWHNSKADLSQGENSDAVFSFIKNSSQINRIIKWKEIVIRRNKRKDAINKPIETFFYTLNSYLKDSGKTIEFNNKDKKLHFYTETSKGITTNHLSSGEKHILIFFAYLILGMKEKERGIFIVDEPELSLHLKWQEKFSSDLLKVAPKLQIIFATHSPEIVGKHRNNIRIIGGDHA
ncbi:AAA family ATPase [Rossellomorea sp. DA94]|uniref:AAA family ATPase n=1 Tax=Rossellomorea sp. DA94 TaxID=3038653 RepID=UPI00244C4578|nr:AAA family ATPase [Rossellomorea sp. DA94]WGG44185.1 AAA family ATPase [Rossellomorea sp. DA94]